MKKQASQVEEIGRYLLPTSFGNWTYLVFGESSHGPRHEILVYGNLYNSSLGDGENVVVSVHASCQLNEIYKTANTECREQLNEAMRVIKKEGKGIIIYLEQESRMSGLVETANYLKKVFNWKNTKSKNKNPLNSNSPKYAIVGQILKQLKVKSIRLLINNLKRIEEVEKADIKVTPVEMFPGM